jgi:aconitate hydratase
MAGPKRPQDRVLLEDVQQSFHDAVGSLTANRKQSKSSDCRFRQ